MTSISISYIIELLPFAITAKDANYRESDKMKNINKIHNRDESPSLKTAKNKVIVDFLSNNEEKKSEAIKLIKQMPQQLIEGILIPLLQKKATTDNIMLTEKNNLLAAEILLEKGSTNVIPHLNSFFSKKKNGFAGFLDKRHYNKVVNLFP